LLDQYLEASSRARLNDADNFLHALSYEGQMESQRVGDQYVTGLARFYRSTSEAQRHTLAEARSLMKLGHEYYFQHKIDKAEEAYTKARQIFARVGDDWEDQYAQHWIAYSDYEQGKTQQSLIKLEGLARTLQKDEFQWLLMRTLHITSSAYHNLNEYSKAINYNRQALALAEHIEDKIGIFNASSILIFQYGSSGNHRQAFEYVQRSFSVMNDCPLNEIQFARHYTIIALAFDSAGFYHAAIDYQKEGLRRAIVMGNVNHISLDYARLGLMFGKLGDFDEAHRNLDLAYATAQTDSDEAPRRSMMAFSTLQSGHLYREQGEFNKAIGSYDQFIALNDPVNFQYDVYEAHKNKLFCYLALGNDSSAGDELKTTLELAERYRSTIVEADNRDDFFDIQQSVYDLAIDFYARMNEPRKAFQYSEDSRSRSLLDLVTGAAEVSTDKKAPDLTFASVAQPLTLAEVQARLPVNGQIIQYDVLTDKLMIWVITRDQFSPIEQKIAQRDLEKRVADYIRVVGNQYDEDTVESAAKDLFEILIKPAESLLDKNKQVYLVPDKFLNALPFGTLISPASGKFLVEDYLLEVSPSSSLLVILSEGAGKKEGRRDERLLSVGNPRFDRDQFPTLSDLPSAGREAEQVAAYYESPRVLTESAATLSEISSEMPGSDVIHFAVHAVADEQAPLHSRLVLARDKAGSDGHSDSDGSLQASAIYRLKLPRTRLAVLSACQTGAERYYGGEGMISLARPFLAAGVPLVVVSLWPVDSNSTAELMISFHRHRKQENLSSAEALRRAQLDMIKRPEQQFREPYAWGAFVAIGGSTSF
jgi:CHAT domain-containing protein